MYEPDNIYVSTWAFSAVALECLKIDHIPDNPTVSIEEVRESSRTNLYRVTLLNITNKLVSVIASCDSHRSFPNWSQGFHPQSQIKVLGIDIQ